jgi:hypothetical protein
MAYAGRTEDARAELHLGIQQLGDPSRWDEVPASALARLLEVAVLLADSEAAELLGQALDGVIAVHGGGGPDDVARYLGQAAVLSGDWQAARSNYTRALEWATSIRHRPEIALTRLALAELLLDEFRVSSSAFGEAEPETRNAKLETRRQALEHLDFAIAEFQAMKMQPSLERALRHKRLLTA